MPAGRPPKPVEQKRLLGNPGKRALPKQDQMILLAPADAPPEPTRPLLKYGQELWDRVWGMGASWLSDQTDLELLMMTCEMIDERWNLRVKVLQSDDHRLRRGLRELDRQIVSNLSLLGFTPTDRGRLGVAEIKARSRIQELMIQGDEW
jgi:hypothetical protein